MSHRPGAGTISVRFRHRPAPLLIRLYLRATGFRAITMPWGAAYYWPWPADSGLIAHEQAHLDQLARLVRCGSWRAIFGCWPATATSGTRWRSRPARSAATDEPAAGRSD